MYFGYTWVLLAGISNRIVFLAIDLFMALGAGEALTVANFCFLLVSFELV